MNETAYALFECADILGLLFVLKRFRSIEIGSKCCGDINEIIQLYDDLNDVQKISFWHEFLRHNSLKTNEGDCDD